MPWTKQKIRKDEKAGFKYTVGTANIPSKRNKSGRTTYETGGWTTYSKDEWKKMPTKPEMVRMQLYNGMKSKVPISDVRAHIGFDKIVPDMVPQDMADYAHAAFDHAKGIGKYYTCEGAGHIRGIRYNPSYQVMEVSFVKRDDIVTFFRVPKNIYSQLEHAGNSVMQGIDGTERHLMGILFWDLVRIRGQRDNARFDFVYGAGDTLKGGSEPGKYAERQLMTIGAREQQAMDASREATVVNKEQPTKDDEIATAVEEFKKILSTNKYLPVQEQRIKAMRAVALRKYGARTPAYREFTSAVEKGWQAVLDVAKLYNLKDAIPKDALE
jgi:hypothetical protein